jgi:hypothetical protein
MKKLTIIGRGTAGCLAASYFTRQTNWQIDWIYDPNIKQQAVGEGTDLTVPTRLADDMNFNVVDLQKIYGSPKLGIRKMNWGHSNSDFTHDFPAPAHGYHFNAVMLQDYIINLLSGNKRINIIHDHVDKHEDLNTDFILDCSGKPSNLADYEIRSEIPVNAVSVKQCYWDGLRFTQTLTIARPYGWVFGIPLLNRCAIGYMYNSDINTLEEVQSDAENIYKEFNLVPSQDGNQFTFKNYIKKTNFSDNVAYNGNASFFLEPLEATSLTCVNRNNSRALELFNKTSLPQNLNEIYRNDMNTISNMIMLHYFAGSKFETPFWTEAKQRAYKTMETARNDKKFVEMINSCNLEGKKRELKFNTLKDYSTWSPRSFLMNLEGLGIKESLAQFLR